MWSRDIEEYVTKNFTADVRDDVVEVIFKSAKLAEMLESVEGKAITDGVISGMHNNIKGILKIVASGKTRDKIDDVIKLGDEVTYLYKILQGWAGVLKEGRFHYGEMQKENTND